MLSPRESTSTVSYGPSIQILSPGSPPTSIRPPHLHLSGRLVRGTSARVGDLSGKRKRKNFKLKIKSLVFSLMQHEKTSSTRMYSLERERVTYSKGEEESFRFGGSTPPRLVPGVRVVDGTIIVSTPVSSTYGPTVPVSLLFPSSRTDNFPTSS